ncbi:tyrosine protein phosphatase yvh1 [Ascosphaera aggregata]|nr:tyrosine protein phosphatase yvh1 [Ascosphaera aggregata]
MALNRVGHENLYIGGIISLRNKLALRQANITHVVSVLKESPADKELLASFKTYHVPVDDVSDEDILQYIPGAVKFIEEGLRFGGGVLCHCTAGKSRSATICIAYLLSRQVGALTPSEALEMIRQTRPLCEPNEGFMEQLELFHRMQCPLDVVGHPDYKRWVYEKAVELSVQCGRGPELEDVRFEDEHAITTASACNSTKDEATEIRCRKCRRKLATLPFIIPHEQSQQGTQCAHIFLHPLTWMRPSLFPEQPPQPNAFGYDASAEAPISGRIVCPNLSCAANIGKFAWQGMPCSCGTWIVPAIGLAKARVDSVDASVRQPSGGAGIRLPPGVRMPPIARKPPAVSTTRGGDGSFGRGRGGVL